MSLRAKIASLIAGKSARSGLFVENRELGDLFREISGNRDHFDNMYPDIVKAARNFAKIEPFFQGANRKPKSSPLINAFYAPNTKMSAYQFRMMLAISTMVHDRFYILVHDKKDDFSAEISRKIEDVVGYDIILPEFVTIISENIIISHGAEQIQVHASRIFAMDDVLNPHDLRCGYSPYHAAKNIASLDDLITAARTKFFKRGGIPEGMLNIIGSADGYETVKGKIKKSMRDGGGNREPIFNHIPQKNGETGAPTISWTPFQSSARDMTNDTMEKSVAKKLGGFIGVPDEVKGYLQNSNYASVAMALRIMQSQVVDDLATSIYSKFTAGLQNIFGNIGGEFAFESENPFFADEAQKIAATDTVNLANIADLQLKGYTVEGAVKILDLPARFLEMADAKNKIEDFSPNSNSSGGENDNISVQNRNNTPETVAEKTSRKTAASEKPQKAEFVFVENNLAKYENAVNIAAKNQMKKDIEKAISKLAAKTAAENDEEKENAQNDEEFQAILTAFILAAIFTSIDQNSAQNLAKLKSLGVDTEKISQFTAGDQRLARSVRKFIETGAPADAERAFENFKKSSSETAKDLNSHLSRVAKDFNTETSTKIREIIADGVKNEISRENLTKNLSKLVDENRAKRLANSEIHRAGTRAEVEFMKYVEKVSDKISAIYKTIRSTTGNPCEFCAAVIGKEVLLSDALIPLGEKITGTAGGEKTFDYESIESANLHPNDHCENVFIFYFKGSD